jgi:large subunit ribosomal protein L11
MAGVITSVQAGSISQLRQARARKERDMAKKVTAIIKLQCPAQKATTGAPIGRLLVLHGVSAPKFVQEFNARSKDYEPGLVVPVVITVYADKSFTFILKTLPHPF